jgi:hypothetical protein
MDYETKILLYRVVEALDAMNNPDWWTIVLTITNIIAVILIAYMQIKLQKRQTEAQEYELYRKLSHIVKEVHFEAKFVVYDMFHYLRNEIPILPEYNHWRKLVNKCNELRHELEDCEIDLELKFSKKFIDIDAYSWVIASMIYFCDLYEALLLEKKITFTNAPLTLEKPYIESVNKIANQVSQEQRESFVFYLMNFLSAKDSINEEETMKQIKQHCKID